MFFGITRPKFVRRSPAPSTEVAKEPLVTTSSGAEGLREGMRGRDGKFGIARSGNDIAVICAGRSGVFARDLDLLDSTATGAVEEIGVPSELLGGVLNGEISLAGFKSRARYSADGVNGPEGGEILEPDMLGFPARLTGGGNDPGPTRGLGCGLGDKTGAVKLSGGSIAPDLGGNAGVVKLEFLGDTP